MASHFGEAGPTPPRSFEALLFHHLDNMMSMIEYRVGSESAQQNQMQLILLDETMMKQLSTRKPVGENEDDEKKERE